MKKTLQLLSYGFESSSGTTPQFNSFFSVFKKELSVELKKIGATDIKFSKGHFEVSGFFTVGSQPYYFSLSDVRGLEYVRTPTLMYRTAKDYKDFTGGSNQWTDIGSDMFRFIS